MIVGVHPLAGFDKRLHYRVPEAWVEQVVIRSGGAILWVS